MSKRPLRARVSELVLIVRHALHVTQQNGITDKRHDHLAKPDAKVDILSVSLTRRNSVPDGCARRIVFLRVF